MISVSWEGLTILNCQQDLAVDVQAGERFNNSNAIQELDNSSTTPLAEGKSLLSLPVFWYVCIMIVKFVICVLFGGR